MKQKTISTNYLAMQALHQGELYQAQELFRKNLKAERNALTLNNLGAFYSEYNILNPDLFERDGRTYALHYVMLAVGEDNTGKSAFALGQIYASLGNYAEAVTWFLQSFEYKESFSAIYNAALCKMRDRDFKQAEIYFKQAESLANTGEMIDVLLGIAFSQAYLDISKAIKTAQLVYKLENNLFLYEKFMLSYLLQDEAKSLAFAEKLQNHCLALPVKAMVLDVFLKSGKTVAAQCYFQTEYDIMKEAGRCTLTDRTAFRKCFSDAKYRNDLIHTAFPAFELKKSCIYIGCPYH